jgi:hypothetical protein
MLETSIYILKIVTMSIRNNIHCGELKLLFILCG